MNADVQLKQCPFCGGDAVLDQRGPIYWCVCCTICNAEMVGEISERRAIDSWNLRTRPPGWLRHE